MQGSTGITLMDRKHKGFFSLDITYIAVGSRIRDSLTGICVLGCLLAFSGAEFE